MAILYIAIMKGEHEYSLRDYVGAFVRVASSRNNAYKDPVLYENLVNFLYKRQLVADQVGVLFQELLPPTTPEFQQTILEEASGTGIVAFTLARRGYKVIATDIEIAALEEIESKNIDRLPILPTNADLNKPLPLASNSVEGVVLVSADRYIKDIDTFLSEIHRVLKMGGVFIWPQTLVGSMLWKLQTSTKQPISKEGLSRILESKGFEILSEEGKPSFWENLQAGIPPYAIPSYLIAKKLST
jgi:SAM-dependent methyltransferase